MKTVCPQCHTDGHHKMSCTDESNPTRKDRVNVPATVREPIVEGAYYEREDGQVVGPAVPLNTAEGKWLLGLLAYNSMKDPRFLHDDFHLTRRVYLVPTDPAEVVAALRSLARGATSSTAGNAFYDASDLVAEKLGVKETNGNP